MVLPVTPLAIQQIAGWSRYVRATMLEVLHQDYVRTAKAKGLRLEAGDVQARPAQRAHPDHHAHRPDLPRLLAGAVITEAIFSYPGLGQLGSGRRERLPGRLCDRACSVGFGVVIGNLLADILYGVVDPRIKY